MPQWTASTRPGPAGCHLNLRVVSQVAAVTLAIYLTGWGPVLWAAYIFIALENMARVGSRVWKVDGPLERHRHGRRPVLRSPRDGCPSELSTSEAASLTVMGAFVLFFVIRMAGAIMEQNETAMEQKEEAEAHLRLSEDRFRSLIQNSSDVTMILGDMGEFRYVSPAIKDLLQYEPEELVGRSLDRLRASRGPRHRPHDCSADEFQAGPGTATLEFRMLRRDGTTRDVEAVVSNQTDRPSVAGLRRQHPRHHRAQEVRGPPRLPRPARPADRPGQPPAHPRPGPADAGAGPAHGRPGGGAVHRPRQLQGLQRLARPRRRRQAAADGRRAPARHPALGRHGRAPRRGRVRHSGRGRLVRPAGPK